MPSEDPLRPSMALCWSLVKLAARVLVLRHAALRVRRRMLGVGRLEERGMPVSAACSPATTAGDSIGATS